MKILTAETDLTSATNISKAPVVRVYNSDSSAITLTRKSNAGTTIGSYSVPPSKVIYCQKSYTDTLEGGAALKATGVGYSEELDIICLGNGGGSSIITSGLIVHLDAENSDSYSGSGSTWSDLTSNNNDFGINGSPTFNSSTPKNFEMDGSDDYMGRASQTISMNNGATIEAWINKTSSSFYSGIFNFRQFQYLNLFWYGSGTKFRFEAHDTAITNRQIFSSAKSYGNWYQFVGVADNNNGLYMYLNGSLETSRTDNVADIPSSITSKMYVGYDNVNYEPKMKVAIIRVYNRPLTSTEVLNNYNVNKSRFGLS